MSIVIRRSPPLMPPGQSDRHRMSAWPPSPGGPGGFADRSGPSPSTSPCSHPGPWHLLIDRQVRWIAPIQGTYLGRRFGFRLVARRQAGITPGSSTTTAVVRRGDGVQRDQPKNLRTRRSMYNEDGCCVAEIEVERLLNCRQRA